MEAAEAYYRGLENLGRQGSSKSWTVNSSGSRFRSLDGSLVVFVLVVDAHAEVDR